MLSLVFVASLRITFDLNNSSSPTKTRSQTLRWLYHSPIRVCFAVFEARLSVAKFFLSFCLSDSDSWLIVNFCALLMAIGDKSNWKPKLLFCKQRLLISRLGVGEGSCFPFPGGGAFKKLSTSIQVGYACCLYSVTSTHVSDTHTPTH